MFPWARFRTKAAIKMHTLLDLRGRIPTFIEVSDGKLADVILDTITPSLAPSTSWIAPTWTSSASTASTAPAHFSSRAPNEAFCFAAATPTPSMSVRRALRSRRRTRVAASRGLPDALRRIHFYDANNDRHLRFLTNNFDLPALTICLLFKSRWAVGVSRQGHIVQSVKDRPRPKTQAL